MNGNNKNGIDCSSIMKNSEEGKNIKIYRNVTVINSVLKDNSCIGDSSVIKYSKLDPYVSIQRNNIVHNSDIGKHTYTGPNTIILHSQIGNFSSISWNVSIGPANHDYSLITTHSFLYSKDSVLNPQIEAYNRYSEECNIGNDVWIGANVVILRGVNVGDGAVIGSNTIVNKDVPPYAIVVGNPGKIIKYRFNRAIIDKLLEIKWWDKKDELIKMNFKQLLKTPTLKTLIELEKLYNKEIK